MTTTPLAPPSAHRSISVGTTGSRIEVLATPAGTAGAVSVYRWRMSAASGGPSPHFHTTFAETFVVEAGAVEFLDGGTWRTLRAGDVAHAPAGGVHVVRRAGDGPVTLLMVCTPGAAREDYFSRLATVTDDGLADLHREHDNHHVVEHGAGGAR